MNMPFPRHSLAAALTLLMATAPASAIDIVVSSAADDGPGSLRAAIDSANAGDPNTPVRILLQLPEGSRTISASLDAPAISHPDVSIIGPAIGFDGERVRLESAVPNNVALLRLAESVRRFTLQDVDLAQGGSDSGPGCLDGIALPLNAEINLTRVRMSDCQQLRSSDSAFGGAVALNGTVTIEDSQFTENRVFSLDGAVGGALSHAIGTLTIRRSLFRGNLANSAPTPSAGFGGAIGLVQFGSPSRLVLDEVAFEGNRADLGGAVHTRIPEADITRSSFLGNAAAFGSAIHASAPNLQAATRLSLGSVSFIGNQASQAGAVDVQGTTAILRQRNVTYQANVAGDSSVDRPGAHLSVRGARIQDTHSTLFAQLASEVNGGPTGAAAACAISLAPGPVVIGGANLFADGSCTAFDASGANLVNADLIAIGFSDRGVAFVELGENSDALDAGVALAPDDGDFSRCTATDALRTPRPSDGDLDGTARCDVGAFELDLSGIYRDGFE